MRPRSPAEHAFLALGPVAERFLRDAAAAGTTRLDGALTEIVALEAAFGRAQLVQALERAVTADGDAARGDDRHIDPVEYLVEQH